MREQHGLTMEEKPGTRFGNYELIRRIDVGGMGEVYLAHQVTAFRRPVAIKIIRSDLVHDTTARARFLREAEVSAHLKHEHILALYDFGEVDGRLYLATPYIEGGTLAARLEKTGPLSLDEAYTLFVPLVQAVAYVHRRGVVHRDLKPSNIMLDTYEGEIYVRLIDFGIASLQGQSASPPLTTAGHEIGTIAYMAPERLSGIAAPSNDIFSLGVILHQMLTGRGPIAAPPPPGTTPPRLPEPVTRFIRRCVAANPAERFATAEELLRAFVQVYADVTQQPLPGSLPSWPSHPPISASRPPVQPAPALSEQIPLSSSNVEPVYPAEKATQTQSRSGVQTAFTSDDYNAPTTSFPMPGPLPFRPVTSRPPLIAPRPPRQRKPKGQRKVPLMFIIMSLSAVLAIGIIGMLIYGIQAVTASSVIVTFTPRVLTINQVFDFKADPQLQAVDVGQAAIPAHEANDTESSTQTGPTSGLVNCHGFFICSQGVSPEDVNNLEMQMQDQLEQTIIQKLQAQISSKHGMQVSEVNFSNVTTSSNPAVGQPGKKVTVTLSAQGNVEYIVNDDANSLVRQQLQAAVTSSGQGFHMIDSTTMLGTPQVQNIDAERGLINLSMAAGAAARYQFTSTQLQSITSSLQNKSVADAQTFLSKQSGIDPQSVAIRFTSGDKNATMPGDTGHIKLNQLDPSVPTITLTPVPAGVSFNNIPNQ